MITFDRRYTEASRLAHLVVIDDYPGFICGTRSGTYLGAEDDEQKIADRMALCGRCATRAEELRDES